MIHIKIVSVRSRDGDELLEPRAKAPDGPSQRRLHAEMARERPMATRVSADSGRGFLIGLALALANLWRRP